MYILQLFALAHVEIEGNVVLQMCALVLVAGLEHNVNKVKLAAYY